MVGIYSEKVPYLIYGVVIPNNFQIISAYFHFLKTVLFPLFANNITEYTL